MPWYRTDNGQGTMHVNYGRKGGPAACVGPRLEGDKGAFDRCCRMSTVLCDAPVGVDLAGKPLTCDAPLCKHHCVHVGDNIDYCPRHAHLAAPLADPRRI